MKPMFNEPSTRLKQVAEDIENACVSATRPRNAALFILDKCPEFKEDFITGSLEFSSHGWMSFAEVKPLVRDSIWVYSRLGNDVYPASIIETGQIYAFTNNGLNPLAKSDATHWKYRYNRPEKPLLVPDKLSVKKLNDTTTVDKAVAELKRAIQESL